MKDTTSQRSFRKERFWADRHEQLSLTGFSVRADWFVLIAVAVVVLILLFLLSWSTYRTTSDTSVLNTEVRRGARTTVNEEQLTRVTDVYRARAQQFAEITNGFVLTDAPSMDVETQNTAADTATSTTSTTTVEQNEDFDAGE